MAPPQHPEWPDVPQDREAFYADLSEFHNRRGTSIDQTPKVSNQQVDLYDLFHLVQGLGGYDVVSAKKLEWRRLAADHYKLGGGNNAAAYAFQLKGVFYRNLAAYAIARVYKQEPPPKEVLEHLTAKGGNLLTRTLESYRAELAAKGKPLDEGDESAGEAQATSRAERINVDGDNAARTSRLRQAPAQRQFFQPDLTSSRQSRQPAPEAPSPQPVMQPDTYATSGQLPVQNLNSASFQISNWAGRDVNRGLHVHPVPTPTHNRARFLEGVKRIREQELENLGRHSKTRVPAQPGTSFPGPNIYHRCMMGLLSGLESEVAFALHHLLKSSYERGDRFLLERYEKLTDALVYEGLKIASRFYDVEWRVQYTEAPSSDSQVLDGLHGTPDLLERIAGLRIRSGHGDLLTGEERVAVSQATELALILRNFCVSEVDDIPRNARYLAGFSYVYDLLTIWLNLPERESVLELKTHALEIAETLTRWWTKETIPRPLYRTLIRYLEEGLQHGNRGWCLASLGAFSHLGIMSTQDPCLEGISRKTIQRLLDQLLLDDDAMNKVVLDFFYRWFGRTENAAAFLEWIASGAISHEPYWRCLIRLMRRETHRVQVVKSEKPAIPAKVPTEILVIPDDLREQIANEEEPERSSKWLRALFEEHEEADIKQIDLWQNYQRCFEKHPVVLLPAADFIKNVSTTFTKATAQVIHGQQGTPPRFIIKGIASRPAPIGLDQESYIKCRWTVLAKEPIEPVQKPAGSNQQINGLKTEHQTEPIQRFRTVERPCGSFVANTEELWDHVLQAHLGLQRKADGKWSVPEVMMDSHGHTIGCCWGDCQRFEGAVPTPGELSKHLRVHIHKETPAELAVKGKHPPRPREGDDYEPGIAWPAEVEYQTFYDTAVDQKGDIAWPIPIGCCLVLRMLARQVGKAVELLKTRPEAPQRATHEWMSTLFTLIWDDLWWFAANNRTLWGQGVYDVVKMIERGLEDEDGTLHVV